MEKKSYGIDLHMHTTGSDGERTVEETMQDALAFGLRQIAITDHNQFSLLEPVEYQGLQVIPGAEFSTFYTTESKRLLEVHVIGLFFDGVPKEIQGVFRDIPIQRKHYLDAIIGQLERLGIFISYEELCNTFPDSNQIGRRHIAEILVKKNYADSINDAFDRLIGNKSPYWIDSTNYMKYKPLKTCVEMIVQNGGFAILAHPYHYHCTNEEVVRLIRDFKEFCGDYPAGMEVYYSKYDETRRGELLKIAKAYELYPSAAGDRHAEKDFFERGDESLLRKMKEAVMMRKTVK